MGRQECKAVLLWAERVSVLCDETCQLSPPGLVEAAMKGMDKDSVINMVYREMVAWRTFRWSRLAPWWASGGYQHIILLEPSLSLAAGVGIFYVILWTAILVLNFFLKFFVILEILNWLSSTIAPPSEQVLVISAHFCRDKKIFVLLHPDLEL